MRVEILKFDNLGRGIGYINNKIIFVPKSVAGDILDITIEKEHANYLEGKIKEIIVPSKKRIEVKCPYYALCGGCDLLHVSLSESLEYKLDKINECLNKNKIEYKVSEIVKCPKQYNYRNKVSLKIIHKKIGYYESNSHKLIEINNCLLLDDAINELINDLNELEINNGKITIRINYKKEFLIVIESDDKLQNINNLINKYSIVGIVLNNKVIFGDDYFIDKINNYLFKISYNSFFQVNPYICSHLFDLISEYTIDSKKILDFYCGVGTLSLVASKDSNKVLGVEIVENAILDAKINASLNNINNVEFICNDTKKVIDKITNEYDTIILDPPRSGIDKNVIDKIINENIKKIIYVSCNESTLIRDLKILLDKYKIVNFKLLDMFVNTEHVECVCALRLR